MTDLILIRAGRKSEDDGHGLVYDVVERAEWQQVTLEGNPGITLERYGLQGRWILVSVAEPLNDNRGASGAYDYYALPLFAGAVDLEAPHQEV